MLAEPYPSKPIRLVIPFAAGSATDAAGRVLAQALSQRLGQSVIVDNRAGANGQIAAMQVSQSPADGYTLFMTTNPTHSAIPYLYKSLPYDPVRVFEPIARVGYKESPQAILNLTWGKLIRAATIQPE